MWDRLERRASWWNALFRFTVDEFFNQLVPRLDLPVTFDDGGHMCEATLAVLMMLARLSSPRSLAPDLEIIFKQDKSRISRFITAAQAHLFSNFAYTFAFNTRRLRRDVPLPLGGMMGRCLGGCVCVGCVWGFSIGWSWRGWTRSECRSPRPSHQSGSIEVSPFSEAANRPAPPEAEFESPQTSNNVWLALSHPHARFWGPSQFLIWERERRRELPFRDLLLRRFS